MQKSYHVSKYALPTVYEYWSSLHWERQLYVTTHSRRITVDAWHESPCPAFTRTRCKIAPQYFRMYHMEREVKLWNNYSRAKLMLLYNCSCWLERRVGRAVIAVRYILPLHARNVAINKAVWPCDRLWLILFHAWCEQIGHWENHLIYFSLKCFFCL